MLLRSIGTVLKNHIKYGVNFGNELSSCGLGDIDIRSELLNSWVKIKDVRNLYYSLVK